jgi:hypothetical protein
MRPVEVIVLVLVHVSAAGAQTTQKTQSYTGCVHGNAKDGYTITLLSTKPAKDPKVASKPAYYALELPDGSKIDLATMANQRVDVVGVLAPVKVNPRTGKPQTLAVKEIQIVPGGC